MAHRVHPKIFRIKSINDWLCRGFYGKNISERLKEDFAIHQFLEKRLKKMSIEKIEIERSPGKINIIIETTKPGLIIGRGGEGIELLVKELEKKIFQKKEEKEVLRLEVREIKSTWASARLVSQWMAQQIEKRVPYRRVLKGALNRIMSEKGIKGARVQLKGRLDGIEIARKEWLQKGSLPRQTLRAEIDYAQTQAYCTYGVVGVKVWIYKGEKS